MPWFMPRHVHWGCSSGAKKILPAQLAPIPQKLHICQDYPCRRPVLGAMRPSLSSDSDWVPKEMFKRAMHDLHPAEQNLEQRYVFFSGPQLPDGRRFDVIIDLCPLRNFRTDN